MPHGLTMPSTSLRAGSASAWRSLCATACARRGQRERWTHDVTARPTKRFVPLETALTTAVRSAQMAPPTAVRVERRERVGRGVGRATRVREERRRRGQRSVARRTGAKRGLDGGQERTVARALDVGALDELARLGEQARADAELAVRRVRAVAGCGQKQRELVCSLLSSCGRESRTDQRGRRR